MSTLQNSLLLLVIAFCGCEEKKDTELERIENDCSIACGYALPLKCSSEKKLTQLQCEARCFSIYEALPDCRAEYLALTGCVADQPEKNWICNEDGEADVVNGVCNNEYDVLGRCMP
jgi:hypothetical protein